MFEGLKAALGLTTTTEKPLRVGDVDPLTHQMLSDLDLPDPAPADAAPPQTDHYASLQEAREVVADWLAQGRDIEQPLPIVFEALFETETQAHVYLSFVRALGLENVRSMATRRFVDSIAATLVVDMSPAPEDIVRIEQALAPAAARVRGQIDGYYLEGESAI